MAGKGRIENLSPWKPGKSGNPRGGSRKVRERKLLREFVADGLQVEIPSEIAEELEKKIAGLQVGQSIAGDLLLEALRGNMEAIKLIVAMEPRALAITAAVETTTPRSPNHVPSSEDEAALLEAARGSEQIH